MSDLPRAARRRLLREQRHFQKHPNAGKAHAAQIERIALHLEECARSWGVVLTDEESDALRSPVLSVREEATKRITAGLKRLADEAPPARVGNKGALLALSMLALAAMPPRR